MTYKNAKTILFASLLVAMILPFSVMSMAEAAPNENANDKAKENQKKQKTHKEHIKDGDIIIPGGYGWINPSEIKSFDSKKSMNENAKNGFDKKFMIEGKDGNAVLSLDKMLKHKKQVDGDIDPEIQYPALSYNQMAIKETNNGVTYFNAYWTVPDAPEEYDDGTIYTFNGVQPFDVSNGGIIFQPVLQYGNYGVCGNIGENWGIIPYMYINLGYGLQEVKGDCTIVNEGDTIRGSVYKSGSYWIVSIQDYNISNSFDYVYIGYNGNADDALVALETYYTNETCEELSGDIDFTSMTLSGSGIPNWDLDEAFGSTWCGMTINLNGQSNVSLNNDN